MAAKRSIAFDDDETPEVAEARLRHLEALTPTRSVIPQDLPLDRISPNPFQARRTFNGLDELAQAIRVQGFVSRLRVRPHPNQGGHFQLLYGERRLRAAQMAGLERVPCDVVDATDDDLIEIGLAENIQRRDLDPLEEARALQVFMQQRGYSIRRLAERIGKHKSYIEDRLALLRAPDDVQHMVEQRADSLQAAREIAKLLSAEERRHLIDAVVAGEMTRDDVRSIVQTAARNEQQDMADCLANHRARKQAQPAKPDPLQALHRSIDRDLQATRIVLERWRANASTGVEEHQVVVDAVATLHQLVAALLNDFGEQ